MSLLNKETRLRVRDLIVIAVIAGVLFFGYSMWKQVQINKVNIDVIAKFLNQAQQPQAQKAPQVKPEEGIEEKK